MFHLVPFRFFPQKTLTIAKIIQFFEFFETTEPALPMVLACFHFLISSTPMKAPFLGACFFCWHAFVSGKMQEQESKASALCSGFVSFLLDDIDKKAILANMLPNQLVCDL